ncbi:MAG TPA: hypothetical protein DHW78_10465 [Ruminococcaceae bacterium]|nr:hypothetical protein [Oscillospiraceae bacterium]
MQVIIHDLDDEFFKSLRREEGITVINANDKYAPCQGCFRCWLKNAGYCVIGDSLQHVGAIIGASDKITIISKITYGGYSSRVKRVLDRSISTSLPLFTYRGWRTHHMKRYHQNQSLDVYLYGRCSDKEKETAREFIEMNRINLGMNEASLTFLEDINELKECSF